MVVTMMRRRRMMMMMMLTSCERYREQARMAEE